MITSATETKLDRARALLRERYGVLNCDTVTSEPVDVDWMADATFAMTVQNTGDVSLSNVDLIVTDHPECDLIVGDLLPGDIVEHQCVLPVLTDSASIDATVTGSPNVGAVVSSNAMATAHLNIVCGDLDSNGVVDILDIIIYLMLVVDLQDPSLYQQKVGDLNLDGSVDIIDAIMGLEHIMNSAPTAINC